MNLKCVIYLLSSAVPASEAESCVTSEPGLYSIFIDKAETLPPPFNEYQLKKKHLMIYFGKATESLLTRLVEQDLRHVNPSTFFRGIGAVLGYRPAAGSLKGKSNQNNYKFSPTDTQQIIKWINDHLFIRWLSLNVDEIESYEPSCISTIRPLLNTKHNPEASKELADLREECRRIARS